MTAPRRKTTAEPSSGPLSAIVLCGGGSRRMGKDKAFIEFEGRPLIARVLETLRTVADEVLIASRRTGPYEGLGAAVVPDLRLGCGPLGGIGGGLRAMKHDLAFVVACDMPFLNAAFLRLLAGRAKGRDGVVPMMGDQYEPLHAVYRRSCLPAVEQSLEAGAFQVFSFFPRVRIRVVPEAEWRRVDPDGLSFVNLNSSAELYRFRCSGRKG